MNRYQLFPRMEPFQLKNINDYVALPSDRQRTAVFKPRGLDVIITPLGHIFDFEGTEIKNPSVLFEFGKVIEIAANIKSIIHGVIVTDTVDLELNLPALYHTSSFFTFSGIKLVCYDMIYPEFDANDIYTNRLDQVDKILGHRSNMKVIEHSAVGSVSDFNKLLIAKFNPYSIESVYVYDNNSRYRLGPSFIKRESPVFEIKSSQRFRTHIKRIIPKDLVLNGVTTTVADALIANFKRGKVEIPLLTSNIALKKGIWDKRANIKELPFWFTGFTVYTDEGIEVIGKKYERFIM